MLLRPTSSTRTDTRLPDTTLLRSFGQRKLYAVGRDRDLRKTVDIAARIFDGSDAGHRRPACEPEFGTERIDAGTQMTLLRDDIDDLRKLAAKEQEGRALGLR